MSKNGIHCGSNGSTRGKKEAGAIEQAQLEAPPKRAEHRKKKPYSPPILTEYGHIPKLAEPGARAGWRKAQRKAPPG